MNAIGAAVVVLGCALTSLLGSITLNSVSVRDFRNGFNELSPDELDPVAGYLTTLVNRLEVTAKLAA